LISPFFTAVGKESVTFDYLNSRYTRFEVGWIPALGNNRTLNDLKYDEINMLMTTTSQAIQWSKQCVHLDGTVGEIALVFVHTSGVWSSQLTAVDNIEVAMKSCHSKFLLRRLSCY
jgi:hypothetical protein